MGAIKKFFKWLQGTPVYYGESEEEKEARDKKDARVLQEHRELEEKAQKKGMTVEEYIKSIGGFSDEDITRFFQAEKIIRERYTARMKLKEQEAWGKLNEEQTENNKEETSPLKKEGIQLQKNIFSWQSLTIGIVLGLIMGIFLASIYGNRYVVTSGGSMGSSVIKLDKWTGKTWMQRYYDDEDGYKVFIWKELKTR